MVFRFQWPLAAQSLVFYISLFVKGKKRKTAADGSDDDGDTRDAEMMAEQAMGEFGESDDEEVN